MRNSDSRRAASHLHVVGEGVSDRDVIFAWHEVETGDTADRIVGGLIASIAAALSAADLADEVEIGAETAIIRASLRNLVVKGLRRNLIRRAIAAREGHESLAGNTRPQRYGRDGESAT